MKRFALAVLLVAACRCATTGTSTPIAIAETCATGAAHDTAVSILGDVANGLVASDWESELAKLVVQFGIDAVKCAVQQVASDANHDAMASTGDQLSALKAARGRQWLSEHP